MSVSLKFHAPAEVPASVLAFWRECLLLRDPAAVFTSSPEWYAMRASPAGDSAIVAVAEDSEGGPLAVFPFLPSSGTLRFAVGPLRMGTSRPVPCLQLCGGDLIEQGLSPVALASTFEEILRKQPRIAGLHFGHLVSGRSLELVTTAARAGFFSVDLHGSLPHYRMKLPATLDECLKARSPKTLSKIQGRERALGRTARAAVAIREIRSEEDLLPWIPAIDDLMAQTWQARLLGHHFSAANLLQISRHGWLRSVLLLAGNHPVAFAAGYQGMGTFVYETIGFDAQYARHSPGTILLYRLLERLYQEDRPVYLDFGEGDADYKRELSNDVIRVSAHLLLKKRLEMAPAVGFHCLCRGLDKTARHAMRMLGVRASLFKHTKKNTAHG